MAHMCGRINLPESTKGPKMCDKESKIASSHPWMSWICCSRGVASMTRPCCAPPTMRQPARIVSRPDLARKRKAQSCQVAQKAVILSPEFNVMGHSFPMGPRPPKPVEVLPEPQDYKAVIMVFLNGGMDSFNVFLGFLCVSAVQDFFM